MCSESVSCSVISNSVRPHGQKPIRLLCPWIPQQEYWVVVPFSRGSSQPRDQTWVSCIARKFFTLWVFAVCVCLGQHLLNPSRKQRHVLLLQRVLGLFPGGASGNQGCCLCSSNLGVFQVTSAHVYLHLFSFQFLGVCDSAEHKTVL